MKTEEELKQMVGKKITCMIEGKFIDDARIQLNEANGKLYICQNQKSGEVCRDMLGYKYSWSLGANAFLYIKGEQVTNIELVVVEELPIFN